MRTVGERIKLQRKNLGFTQGDLSGPNLSHSMISLIERNHTKPSLKTLEHIASKLGVSVSYLLGEAEGNDSVEVETNNKERVISMCIALINSKKYENAYKALEPLAHDENNFTIRGKALKLLSEISMNKGEYEEAIRYLNDCLVYITPFDLNYHIEVYSSLATCYRQLENYSSCIDHALYASILLRTQYHEFDKIVHLKVLYNLAYGYCKTNQFIRGIVHIKEALSLMETSSVFYQEDRFYMLKGLAELHLGQPKDGIQSTLYALSRIDRSSPDSNYSDCLLHLGILYRQVGELSKSQDYLKKSLTIAKTHHQEHHVVDTYYELAATAYEQQNLEKAEEYCQQGILYSHSFKESKAKLLAMMARIKFKQNSLGESLIYINDCEKFCKEFNISYILSHCYAIKAQILEEQQNYAEANDMLKKSNNLLSSMYSSS
ncbi:helix-turn-helix domain-containing protein [Bacillus sp. JZ8]